MVLVQYVGVTWIGTCVFFIMAALKLEGKATYNWFITFIPRFIVCGADLIWIIIRMSTHRRNLMMDPQVVSMKRKWFYLVSCWLEVLFEILLCLRLDSIADISLYYCFIPLWILLVGYIINYFHYQIQVIHQD